MIGQRNSTAWVVSKHVLISGIAFVMLYPILWMLGRLIQTGTYDLYRDLVLATGMELAKLHEWLVGNSGQPVLPVSN